jgi:hypothetical protein
MAKTKLSHPNKSHPGKSGPKTKIQGAVTPKVYIDPGRVIILTKYGGGNFSAGVRAAADLVESLGKEA